MDKTARITASRLKEVLDYDPKTGVFTWRSRPIKYDRAGQEAGVLEPSGYRTIRVDGVQHQSQRLAWLYMTGEHPKRLIQFVDGNKQNLAFKNLYCSPYSQEHHDYSSKEGRAAYMAEYRRQNPQFACGSHFKRDYGITKEQYHAMAHAQDGLCAICKKPETRKSKAGTSWLSIDHDHATGQVRALLCRACNLAVGYLREDPERAEKVAEYLRRHKV